MRPLDFGPSSALQFHRHNNTSLAARNHRASHLIVERMFVECSLHRPGALVDIDPEQHDGTVGGELRRDRHRITRRPVATRYR